MTSLAPWTQCSIYPPVILLQLNESLNSITGQENVPKVNKQTFLRSNSNVNISSIFILAFILSNNKFVNALKDAADCWLFGHGQVVLHNTFLTTSKLLTPNMYWWSHKTLPPYTECISVWMALALSPFDHRKSNRTLFLLGCFQWQCDVIVTKLTACIQN